MKNFLLRNKKITITGFFIFALLCLGILVFFMEKNMRTEITTSNNQSSKSHKNMSSSESSKIVDEVTESRAESAMSESIASTETIEELSDKEKCEKVAEQFARLYTSFDGENPTDYMEESLQFLVPELAKQTRELNQNVRPTNELYSREVTDISFNWISESPLVIEVEVEGIFYSEDKETETETKTVYNLVMMNDENGKWLIANFSIGANNE